jgi:steroid delta-isomerase-like uncharacterized protein
MTTAAVLSVHNKVVYRRFIDEIFNEGRLEKLDEVLAPSYIYHDAPEGTMPGTEGVKKVVTMFRAAFPDLKITIDDQVSEGDKVCSRTTMRGTHQGAIFGVPPTGKSVTMHGITMVRIADGRVFESWVKNDLMGLMRQLG